MYTSVESSDAQQALATAIDQATDLVNTLRMPVRTERAMRVPDYVGRGPRIKPQDLVRMILGHRALARRVSQPQMLVSLQVYTPAGRPAVQISFV